MKVIWDWLVKNVPNIFSVIGIVLTIYFGAFYVPKSFRDAEKERIDGAEKRIIQSIKEVTYTDSSITYDEIGVIISAEEAQLNQKLPHDEDELLTIVEGSFMQDKFLSLIDRRNLIRKIESIKNKTIKIADDTTRHIDSALYNSIVPRNETSLSSKRENWLTSKLKSSLFPLLSAILGLLSATTLFVKSKREDAIQEEVKNNEVTMDVDETKMSAFQYESVIQSILESQSQVEGLQRYSSSDNGFDFGFTSNGEYYFIQIKFLQKNKVGLNSIEGFSRNIKGNEGNFWFIYNTDLTTLAKKTSDDLSKLSNDRRQIRFIYLPDPHLLKVKVDKLLS